MSELVGVEREETQLLNALDIIRSIERASSGDPAAQNMLAATKLITAAALLRRESIGAHFRRDYPQRANNPVRSFLTLQDADTVIAECSDGSRTEHERSTQ
jgi:L-aspartate oxidase